MSTFYLDLEGGNDANDGTTFANRWKTFASGATAARIAPGDTILVMASPNENSLGQNATWTQNSKTVTLTTAVTANITDCETAWTASANVTSTADTGIFKENTKSAKHVIASAFTTGLAAYFATGTLNLSSYQQVSFWIYNTLAIANGSTLSLRLCSDTAGVTTVNTIAIPAIPSVNQWVPITVDTAGALGSSIQSAALYCDADPGTITVQLDNILACKASSSADALTLTSLLGKVWNLCWVASTTYATNDICKPTQTNRNGYRYKVTAGGGGAAGSSEPTWPLEIGVTVTDGALTWTCEGLEDTWYAIQSINGTTVKLDNGANTLGSAGRGYGGTTETVTAYKRETIKSAMVSVTSTVVYAVQDSGTDGTPITFSGGWDRSAMSSQSGETWVSAQNGLGIMFDYNNKNFVAMNNLNSTKSWMGVRSNGLGNSLRNSHANSCTVQACGHNASAPNLSVIGASFCNGISSGVLSTPTSGIINLNRVSVSNNLDSGISDSANFATRFLGIIDEVETNNNLNYGITLQNNPTIRRARTNNNGIAGMFLRMGGTLINSLIQDSTEFWTLDTLSEEYIYSQKHDQTTDNHLITTDGGTIVSATDQRHTASGISWKFRPTSTNRSSAYPLRLPVAKIACVANALVTVSIYTYRDNTNVNGTLKVRGGQIAGVPTDVTVACAPSINTWVQSSNLTFTPTETGVVEVIFEVYDGVGTTNNFWIDDLSIG